MTEENAKQAAERLTKEARRALKNAAHYIASNAERPSLDLLFQAAVSLGEAAAPRSELLTLWVRKHEAGDPEAPEFSVMLEALTDDLFAAIDTVTAAWRARVERAELERDEARRELAAVRDQVDRAAKSVLATTYNSRRQT